MMEPTVYNSINDFFYDSFSFGSFFQALIHLNSATSMASEESVWKNWVRSSLLKLVEDGVTHIEIRGFSNFISSNGRKVYTPAQIVALYLEIIDGK